jgi:hypothetical protein
MNTESNTRQTKKRKKEEGKKEGKKSNIFKMKNIVRLRENF